MVPWWGQRPLLVRPRHASPRDEAAGGKHALAQLGRQLELLGLLDVVGKPRTKAEPQGLCMARRARWFIVVWCSPHLLRDLELLELLES